MADDFASAVLVALLRHALAEDGAEGAVAVPADALLPLEDKRRLLSDVAAAHGLLPLLRVGRVIPRLPPHPVVSALRAATDPVDLVARWRRLERFAHSRHRVVLHETGPGHLVAEHVGPPGSPPAPAEDALVLGVLIGLLQDMGVEGLTVTLDVDVLADGVLSAPPPDARTARWRVTWSSQSPPVRPSGRGTALDPTGTDPTGTDPTGTDPTGTDPTGTDPTGTDPIARARALFTGDLARAWTVGDLAARLGVSVRTLQRLLRSADGFAALLGAVRTEHAAELLVTSSHPLSVVGFACGFADQPHFTRTFRRRTAMTPAAYRSAFTPLSRPGTGRPADL